MLYQIELVYLPILSIDPLLNPIVFLFLQEAARLMRVSLSAITNKILMMTLTGRTSTQRKCHMSHQTCHKVKIEILSLREK